MKVENLLNHFKGAKSPKVQAAAMLDIHPTTIDQWLRRREGIVPEKYAYMIAAKTGLDVGEEDYQK